MNIQAPFKIFKVYCEVLFKDFLGLIKIVHEKLDEEIFTITILRTL